MNTFRPARRRFVFLASTAPLVVAASIVTPPGLVARGSPPPRQSGRVLMRSTRVVTLAAPRPMVVARRHFPAHGRSIIPPLMRATAPLAPIAVPNPLFVRVSQQAPRPAIAPIMRSTTLIRLVQAAPKPLFVRPSPQSSRPPARPMFASATTPLIVATPQPPFTARRHFPTARRMATPPLMRSTPPVTASRPTSLIVRPPYSPRRTATTPLLARTAALSSSPAQTLDSLSWSLLLNPQAVYPDGILSGIQAVFLSDPTLLAEFGGRIFLHDAEDGVAYPYVVVDSLTSVPHFHTGTPYYEVESVCFSIWDTSADNARLAGRSVMRAFDRFRRISLRDGVAVTLVRKHQALVGSDVRGVGSARMYQYAIDYDAYTSRDLTPL